MVLSFLHYSFKGSAITLYTRLSLKALQLPRTLSQTSINSRSEFFFVVATGGKMAGSPIAIVTSYANQSIIKIIPGKRGAGVGNRLPEKRDEYYIDESQLEVNPKRVGDLSPLVLCFAIHFRG